ncbi:MAG TPA: tetratricopeptide repeat protein, partial [Polyangiaceae bacterium]
VLEDLEDLPRAQLLMEQTLLSEQKSLGSEHPSLAVTRAQLARLLFKAGRIDEAREHAREALRVAANQPEGWAYHASIKTWTAGIL